MYELVIPNSVEKDIRRLDKPIERELHEHHLVILKEDPYKGEPLRGALKGVWSYHFTFRSAQYRIAYEILESRRVLLLVMIGKRGDFYQALARRLGF